MTPEEIASKREAGVALFPYILRLAVSGSAIIAIDISGMLFEFVVFGEAKSSHTEFGIYTGVAIVIHSIIWRRGPLKIV